MVKQQPTFDSGRTSPSADLAKPSSLAGTTARSPHGRGNPETILTSLNPDGMNPARSAGTASSHSATATASVSGLAEQQPPAPTSPEVSTKTLSTGEKVILHEDGEISFVSPDGKTVAAEKVGENTMTEARYWSSLAAAAAANYFVTSVVQKGVTATLNGVPSAVSEAMGQGTVPPMNVPESELANWVGTGATTYAEQRTGWFGVPLPGTKEVLFYREVEPDTYIKIRVVVSPDGAVSVPEGDWTPLN